MENNSLPQNTSWNTSFFTQLFFNKWNTQPDIWQFNTHNL